MLCMCSWKPADPIQAAVLVLGYVYSKELVTEPMAFEEFIHKYKVIFNYPDENKAENEVQNYISELKGIVNRFTG